jgi:hypothetical protein
MLSIEDTEKLITTMRAQAKSLEVGADALESALAPVKAAAASIENWNLATRAFFEFWGGKEMLTKSTSPGKLDIKA